MRLNDVQHARAVAAMLNETNKATASLCPTLDEIVAANTEKHQAHLAERKAYDEYRREKVTVVEIEWDGEREVEYTREDLEGEWVDEAEHAMGGY